MIRPSDLKNVCRVSKQFHKLAVRFLYRNVSLDLGSDNDNRLSSFLNPRNIGLKHIRQLRLYLAESTDRCNQERQAQFATRMILEFLPEDILEEFRCVYNIGITRDTRDHSNTAHGACFPIWRYTAAVLMLTVIFGTAGALGRHFLPKHYYSSTSVSAR